MYRNNRYTHISGIQPISHSHKMALIFVGFYYLYWKSGMAWREKKRKTERERERVFFLFTPSSRRREELNKGWEFREAASTGPNICKRSGQNVLFFFRPALKINARGGRETEKLIVPLRTPKNIRVEESGYMFLESGCVLIIFTNINNIAHCNLP